MAAATSASAGVVVVVVVVFVLLAAHAGVALKCYSCFTSRSVSQSCGDPFTLRGQVHAVDCGNVTRPTSPGRSFCKKVKQLKDRSPTVTRMCDWAVNESAVCDTVSPGTEDLEVLHCSACSTDGCNGSGALLPTVALCTALLLLLLGT